LKYEKILHQQRIDLPTSPVSLISIAFLFVGIWKSLHVSREIRSLRHRH